MTKWKNYINYNSSVIQSFTDTIDTLQTHIDDLETRIEALELKINNPSTGDYLRVNTTLLHLSPIKSFVTNNNEQRTPVFIDDKIVKSFTNNKEVYVYTNQTVSGLYIDEVPFVSYNDCEKYKNTSAFYKFTGSDKGVKHHIVSINTKALKDIKLYFSTDSHLDIANASNGDTCFVLPIGIQSAVTKQLPIKVSSDLIPTEKIVTKAVDTTVKVTKKVNKIK